MIDDEFSRIVNELEALPKGNITYKVIRGKKRMYLQWYENSKKQSKYIRAKDEIEVLTKVKKRNELRDRLKELIELESRFADVEHGNQAIVMEDAPKYVINTKDEKDYKTNVVLGKQLVEMCSSVREYEARECLCGIKKFLSLKSDGRICLLYGLRRTGKTTLIFQAISELPIDETAYIKILPSNDMAMLNKDLKRLYENGIRFVFIDEVTLMSDFVDTASLLSDVYGIMGMKIVLSGTDSLGFALTMDEELYDRAYMIHTTFIPFREYSRLLNISDIDQYICYGGTLKAGENDFDDLQLRDEGLSFRDDESTRRYIDTAIVRNIQHSLKCYKNGGHFRNLLNLYEAGELTSAINRIIEDMNHRFLVSVLTKDFVSHDLGSARQLSRKKAAIEGTTDVLEDIDVKQITERLVDILDIRNKDEAKVEITDAHLSEIKEYLFILDLIVDCPSETISSAEKIENIIFSQPGMRYCQAQALVYSIMKDKNFSQYSGKIKHQACERILEEVRGRMLEEMILLETNIVLTKGKRAFKLLFPIGEFDMVVADEKNCTCEIYEIKHSSEIVSSQYKHLVNSSMCEQTEFKYGEIKSKNVLYNGESTVVDGINYMNIKDYLCGIGKA
ncbi:AAA family ATPase [Butyrivibrio sp. YAB3001]|uniref:AAA family ATPase n=1 Tax=Butyrivibrio sp. YAB3001 TaxID=1520812 RepID=UPI0008F6905F|nr:AAA family ATPase [Butyrivibrio sp. YAB3001]SFB82557.1 AAA domain-containing protein [Butyrivibrio sp. YAB3001]